MKKKLKLFFPLVLIIFFSFNVYSQEAEQEKKNEENIEGQNVPAVKVPSDFGFYLGTQIIFSSLKNQIAPQMGTALNLGAEYEYKGIRMLSIVPSLDFSLFHYGFYNKRAYICEIENRAALTMSFLLDTPFLARFEISPWTVSIGGGLAFFIRIGLLEPGIKPDEPNPEGLRASEEVKAINRFFWQKGRFIYPSLRFKTEYTLSSGWKTGIQVKAFFPMANFWDKSINKWSDSLILQAGVVLHPPVKR